MKPRLKVSNIEAHVTDGWICCPFCQTIHKLDDELLQQRARLYCPCNAFMIFKHENHSQVQRYYRQKGFDPHMNEGYRAIMWHNFTHKEEYHNHYITLGYKVVKP